jgi:hypothetical protein
MSGKWFNVVSYGLNAREEIDYDAMERKAHEARPKLIIAGASAYSLRIDFERFAKVAKAVGATPLDRLPDAWESEALTGMDREVRVLAAQIFECIEVTGGREPCLGTGDVETHHTSVAVLHRQLGNVAGLCGRSNGGEQHTDADRVPRRSRLRLPFSEPRERLIDHGMEIESTFAMQLRCKSHFGIDDAIDP